MQYLSRNMIASLDKHPLNIRNIKDTQGGDPGLQRMPQKFQTVIFYKILNI